MEKLDVEHDDTPDEVVERINRVLERAKVKVKFVYNKEESGEGTVVYDLKIG